MNGLKMISRSETVAGVAGQADSLRPGPVSRAKGIRRLFTQVELSIKAELDARPVLDVHHGRVTTNERQHVLQIHCNACMAAAVLMSLAATLAPNVATPIRRKV